MVHAPGIQKRPSRGAETRSADAVTAVCTLHRRFPIIIAENDTPSERYLLEMEQRAT
jgi:hypothetical protein